MAIIGTVPMTGVIAPTASSDTYAVTDTKYGKDGLRNVSTISDRNAITEDRRKSGMLVGVDADGKLYKLKPSPWAFDDTDWILFTNGGSKEIVFTSNGVDLSYTFTHNLNNINHNLRTIFTVDNSVFETGVSYGENQDIITLNIPIASGEEFKIIVF